MNKFVFVVFSLFVSGISVFAQNALERDLDESFKSYDLVKLDGTEMLRKAKSEQPIEVKGGGRTFEFVLMPNNLRAKNYRAIETDASGDRELEQSEVFTYKGKLSNDPDSEVRFTVRQGEIEGLIYTGDNKKFFVASAEKFSQYAQASDVVVYAEDDLLKTVDLSNDTPQPPDDIEGKIDFGLDIIKGYNNRHAAEFEMSGALAATDVRTVEVATDADYQWVTQSGGSAAANSEILGILNLVDGIYRRDLNLTISVTFQHAWTTSDSYAASSAQALLDSFLGYWNASYPASQYPRDTAHLFTGKFSNQGIAYQGVVCRGTSYAYGLSARSGVNYLITAHEIGHNLGADHIDNSGACANSMMNPFLTGSVISYCDTSKLQIAGYTASNGSCLVSGGTITPPIPTPTPVATPTPTAIPPSNCTYSLSSTSQSFSSTGGIGSVNVTTGNCSYSSYVAIDSPFIIVTNGTNGTGSGTVNFTVDANPGAARAGTIFVAGQLFNVNQASAGIRRKKILLSPNP